MLVNGDRTAEPDEIFYVNLSGESGATIGDGQGLGTILNDDGAALLADFGGQTGAAGIILEQVQHITPLALAMWSGQPQAAAASAIQFRIDDLPAGQLGLALGNTITLDINANGVGWYTDLGTPAAGRVDLLTVVSHEIGHLLGYDHSDVAGDLMAATLPLGTRRLPSSTPMITYDLPGSAVVLPQLLPEHRLNVMPCDLADPLLTSNGDCDTGADSDLWLLPVVPRDYVQGQRMSSEAAQARTLKTIADEEIEILDEDLLDLLAAGQA